MLAWRLPEHPAAHVSGLEVRLGRLHGTEGQALQPSPVKPGNPAAPKLTSMIHLLVLPPGSSRGGGIRWEEGGKPNCRYSWGLRALRVPEMGRSNFQLQIGNGVLTVRCAVPENTATCCNPSPTALGRSWAGKGTSPRSSQDSAPTTAPAVMLPR